MQSTDYYSNAEIRHNVHASIKVFTVVWLKIPFFWPMDTV